MKKIIVLGAIGKTERQNRDDMRVISRGGVYIQPQSTHRQGSSVGD